MTLPLQKTYAGLPEIFFEKIAPLPVSAPRGIIFNHRLAVFLGVSRREDSREEFPAEWLPLLAGNQVPAGATPLAQAYAGHQFGHFNKLGDGRAVLLGEITAADGSLYDIQLKGSGPTSFSRRGDGRAALGPMLREYIMSEAMYALGVPTTRSLAVVATGEPVYRETVLPGAVLTRVARSHLRVGTFEYAAAYGGEPALRALADYAIRRHAPERETESAPEKYLNFFAGCAERQIKLISQWMQLGFIHGVMNTDNMTISGETIDYGPCAFMDRFSPGRVYSSIDRAGRYAYAQQPPIAVWNLTRLAEALLPLFAPDAQEAVTRVNEILHGLPAQLQREWAGAMRAKFGLGEERPEDLPLMQEFLSLLEKNGADYTNSFSYLTYGAHARPWMQGEEFSQWRRRWESRSAAEADPRPLMEKTNPVRIPRNHRVEAALREAEAGDLRPVYDLLRALEEPYRPDSRFARYEEAPDEETEKGHVTFCGT